MAGSGRGGQGPDAGEDLDQQVVVGAALRVNLTDEVPPSLTLIADGVATSTGPEAGLTTMRTPVPSHCCLVAARTAQRTPAMRPAMA